MAHRAAPAARGRAVRIGVRVAGLALVLLALGGPYLLGSGRTAAGVPGPAAGGPAPAAAGVSAAVAPEPGPAGGPAVGGTAPVAAVDQAGTASAGTPLGGGAPRLDYADVALKAGLVILLLLVTLRVMRRFGAGPRDGSAQLTVLESRGVGPKSQVMLLAVGDRRLVVGVTPGGMTTLADLASGTLAAGEPANATPVPAGAPAGVGVSALAAALRQAVPFRRGVHS